MTEYILSSSGNQLAYRKSEGDAGKPRLVWMSGFNSDMAGSKVLALETWAADNRYPFLAFDYSGHGLSGGDFADGTISSWRSDCLSVLGELANEPLVLIGSSMGGWMALLSALALPEQVTAMVLIAPAPDFTQKLMWPEFSEDAKRAIMEQGVWMRPSDYGDPYPITRDLIEDGKNWQILDDDIALDIPIRILQGMEDPDVPWTHAQLLVSALTSRDVVFSLIKDGDHRLSREQDIARLLATVSGLVKTLQPPE